MAKMQQVGAITVWMIIFVGLWLLSTVFLVILYTGQEELRTTTKQAIDAKNRAISDDEEGKIKLVTEARPEGPTIVGLMEQSRAATAELTTGQGTDDVATARSKLEQFVSRMKGDPALSKAADDKDPTYLSVLTSLWGAYESARTQLANERGQAEIAEAKRKELDAQMESLKKEFETRTRTISGQLEEAESGRAQYRADRDAFVSNLEKEFEASLADVTSALTQERQRIAGLERENGELRRKLIDMQERFGAALSATTDMATVRQPDGTILLAVPGDPTVYINLGNRDRVLLGMQFTVYAADTGIPADGRGKALVEVVSIGPESSECKIVRLGSNQVIVEGDLVANPVYDRHRALTFMTIGEFDLNHDGQADPDGVATVEAMITEWGGATTQDLSALTDFVVVGMAPRRPRATGDATGEQAERQIAIQKRWEDYNQRLTAAQNLAVPVLPQEVFLNLLGYRANSTVR